MGSIPYQSEVDSRTGRSQGARLRNSYDAEAFGGGNGLQKAGAGLVDAGDELRYERVRKEREQSIYSEAMFDPTDVINGVKQEAGADALGYKDKVKTAYQNYVDEYVNGIENDNVRKDVREKLMGRLPSYTNQADVYERTVRAETSKERTNEVLYTLRNRVLSDPNAYDEAVRLGGEAVDTYAVGLDGKSKQAMTKQYAYDLAKSRFEGKLNRATTAADLDGVAAELNTPDWQQRLIPKDYEDINDKIVAGKRAYQQQVGSEAKATLKGLEERSKDATTLIPQQELVDAQAKVSASQDIGAQQRMARVVRDQSIVRSERKLTPSQMRARMEQTSQQKDTTADGALPPTLAVAVNKAAADYGISASYLDSTIMREFGGELAKPNPDFGARNPEPGATSTGVMQFTDGTFKKLVQDPAVASALGVTKDMTEEQVLALRSNPEKAIVAGAILAKQNKAYMEQNIGRPVSDVELYMAHFLGAPEATRFLKTMEADGNVDAATAFPDAAKMNANVFKSKDGKPLTLAQVYDNISRSFTASSSQVTYDDNQVRKSMLDKMETALNSNEGMKFAAAVGVVSLTPLDQEGAFPARAAALKTASTYYGRQLQPFTPDEEAYIQKTINDGSVDKTLGLMTSIQSMGPDGARAAFSQLKLKAPAFSHAGMLALDGDPATASDIIRGYKRMKENPAVLTALKFKEDAASVDFQRAVGPALSRIPPAERQAAQEAALAYLVETQGANGKEYTSSTYQDAVTKTLGGRIDKVNGEKTFLPAGIKAVDVRKVLSLMTLNDYVSMSINGSTPMHADGAAIDPRDMEDEVKLRAIGGDQYALADGEGAFLWTGKTTPDGYPEKFIIELTPEKVRSILARRYQAPGYGRGGNVLNQ